MNTDQHGKGPLRWTLTLFAAAAVIVIIFGVFGPGGYLRGQSNISPSAETSTVYTQAFPSFPAAVKDFFGIKPAPVQPIAYTHTVHVLQNEMKCVECHVGVETGPVASIPGISKCMECHDQIATDKPEIQKLAAYQKRNEDIPWQRVYGWSKSSHVRFNHAPHIRAGVDCAKCHGDIAHMTTAQHVVDHTMGFCIGCHKEKQASNDCMTCHY